MSNFIIGSIYSFLFFTLFIGLELASRKIHYSGEITRKLAHVFSGVFGIFMAAVLNYWVFLFFCIIFLVVISISYLTKLFTSIHNVQRRTLGEIFLPIGIIIAYILSGGNGNVFVTSVLILTISDPLAGLVVSEPKFKKFVHGGSVIFFISALLILFIFIKLPILYLVIIALVTTFVERISKYGTDNITIPLAASLTLKLFL